MKSPFETVRQIFFENLDRARENQRYNFSHSDKYMIWIVGFSVGGLSIIVTNLTSFNQLFSHTVIKAVLILLTISIVAGIIYRWAFYLYQVQYQKIEFYLQGAFSDKEIMETEADDLKDETDINEIIRRIKIGFGEDLSYVVEIYNKSDQNEKDSLLKGLKIHYKNMSDWAKGDFDTAMKYVKDTYKRAFGFSNKKSERLFKANSARMRMFKFLGWTTTIAFLISCFTFIAVIIMLTALY